MIWGTNPLERLNKEISLNKDIKRRTNLVCIFPNDAGMPRSLAWRAASCWSSRRNGSWSAGSSSPRPLGDELGGLRRRVVLRPADAGQRTTALSDVSLRRIRRCEIGQSRPGGFQVQAERAVVFRDMRVCRRRRCPTLGVPESGSIKVSGPGKSLPVV